MKWVTLLYVSPSIIKQENLNQVFNKIFLLLVFFLLMISARSLYIPFPPNSPQVRTSVLSTFSYFPTIFTRFKNLSLHVPESSSYFLPGYSFYLILPTLPLSPYIVNIFWTAWKGITHFHDTVISTYSKVQANHMLIVQSSPLQF